MTRTPTTRPFPWTSLPSLRRADLAVARDALRRLPPAAPRPDEALGARWQELLGGPCDAAPGVPRAVARAEAPATPSFTAVLTRDDGATLLAQLSRPLARALVARALSLRDGERPGADDPIVPAEEGALMALGAKVVALVDPCDLGLRLRAVTDDADEAIRVMHERAGAGAPFIAWPWSLRASVGAGWLTLLLPPRVTPPRRAAPRAALRRAEVIVSLLGARDLWSVAALRALGVGCVLRATSLRVERGALVGGVDLALGDLSAPSFSATLTPQGALIDAPATHPGAPVTDTPPPLEEATQTTPRAVIDAVPVELTLELARTRATVGELSAWRVGEVIEFPTRIGETVTLRAGGAPFAVGELVEVDGCVAARITELL